MDMLLLYTHTEANNDTETVSEDTPTKRCTKCKTERPLTPKYWQRDSKTDNGYHAHCKTCRRAYDRQRDERRKRRIWRQCQQRALAANTRYRQNAPQAPDSHFLTTDDVLHVYAQQRGVCAYCGLSLHGTSWHVDHHTPTSAGGPNTRANINACCARCNSRKNAMTPDQWTSYLASVGIVTDTTPEGMPVQRQLLGRTTTMNA